MPVPTHPTSTPTCGARCSVRRRWCFARSQEDRSVVDLLDSDFTFVDERLARHYGIPGVLGSRMRRISLPEDSPRRGLLGQGSILTLTSAANRTSPVVRGKWILEKLGRHRRSHRPVSRPTWKRIPSK